MDRSSAPFTRPTQTRRPAGRGPDRAAAADQEVVGPADPPRAHRATGHRDLRWPRSGRWFVRLGLNRRRCLDADGEPPRDRARSWPATGGPHGPSRREEGRPDPRRRRLAGPRPRHRSSTAPATGPRQRRRPRRLRLPALRHRRVLPAGLHRAPARRDRHAPRSGSGPGPERSSPRTASPASRASSPTTAPATARRTSPGPSLHGARHQRIRPYTPKHNGKVERYNRILAEEFLYARAWYLRSRTRRSHPGLEHPLQLPSAPHRRREPATRHTTRHRRHQRHALIHLVGRWELRPLGPSVLLRARGLDSASSLWLPRATTFAGRFGR